MRHPYRIAALLALGAGASVAGAGPTPGGILTEIRNLHLKDLQARAFTLTEEQTLTIDGVAFQKSDLFGDLARSWILDAESRQVKWTSDHSKLVSRGRVTRTIKDTVRLPVGRYELYYSTFPTNAWHFDSDLEWWQMVRSRGLSLEDYEDAADELRLTLGGRGSSQPLDLAARKPGRDEVVSLTGAGISDRKSRAFTLPRPATVEVYALGEVTEDGRFDHGWILDTKTRKRVWSFEYSKSEPAGGAKKNRMVRESLRLPAGSYAAVYVTDDSHAPARWNSQPPYDPSHWGLTLRVKDPQLVKDIRTGEYLEQPDRNVIVALTRVRDSERRQQGFTLKEPMEVRVYALGEGSGSELADYGWITNARTSEKVWTMRYPDTEDAGGAKKNRLAETVLRLERGSYLVNYVSDDSHSYKDWNSAAPPDPERWGITVSGVDGSYAPAKVAAYTEAEASGDTLVNLTRVGDDAHKKQRFSLDKTSAVQIVAVGEGRSGEMFDYGWIEDSSGRAVWEMTYRATDAAGGSTKNRQFQGVLKLKAGNYTAHYVTDDSHAYRDWNDTPPQDQEAWGMRIALVSGAP